MSAIPLPYFPELNKEYTLRDNVTVTLYQDSISIFDVDNFETKVKQLNRRLRKLGSPEISFVQTGKENQTYKGLHWYDPDITVTLYLFDIVYPVFKINGWKFVGTVDHVEHLLHSVKGIAIPEHYRTGDPNCDHCRMDRQRHETAIMINDAGEFMQLGKSCLSLYFGLDAGDCVLMSDMSKLNKYLSVDNENPDSELDEDPQDGILRRFGRPTYTLSTYLAFVALSTRLYGFTSMSEASTGRRQSTAYSAWDMYLDCGKDGSVKPTDEDRTLGALVAEWAKTIPGNSEYILNLRQIAHNGIVSRNTLGFAASMIKAYKKDNQSKLEASANSSEWIGKVGEKIALIVDCVFVSNPIDTAYGLLYVNTFKDQHGNVIVWKTGSTCEKGPCKLKATVKAHDTYNGVKQTIITRAKIEIE